MYMHLYIICDFAAGRITMNHSSAPERSKSFCTLTTPILKLRQSAILLVAGDLSLAERWPLISIHCRY